MNTVPARQTEPEIVSGYSFRPSDLNVADRHHGISAFMRIRNGEQFLEATIRSHIQYFDEIVAVYNQCTDKTADILMSLQREFGSCKIRVIHYADHVFPPGSNGHASTPEDSPSSLVNYYNCALAATRYQYATKLDDDHIAVDATTKAVTESIRTGQAASNTMLCFSGLNVFRRNDGSLGVLASDPVSGSGDIGFFRVTADTTFHHDRRFEKFSRGNQRRVFAGFLYWHLKYIKADMGFGNYDLHKNPSSRYAKRKGALQKENLPIIEPSELAADRRPGLYTRLLATVSGKHDLTNHRDAAIGMTFPDKTVEEAIQRTVRPEFHSVFRPNSRDENMKAA